ncbi:MAG TPA: magnesium transporter [Gemmatimonadales bacterium]|nr:magnesium transporter [Gemmatimonadales bacterium]
MTDPANLPDLRLDELKELAEQENWSEFLRRAQHLHPSDLADVLAALDEPTRIRAIAELPIELASNALAEMEVAEHPEELLLAVGPEYAAELVEELPTDDAADLVGELPTADREAVLAEVTDRKEVEELLQYPEDSAGGLMGTDVVTVREDETLGSAIDAIRGQCAEDESQLYQIYAVDSDGDLRGIVPVARLIVSPPTRLVRDVMEQPIVQVQPRQDQEEVARLMARYNVAAVPVVNEKGKLLGRITFDDVVDVVEAETTEDILKFGGMEALDAPYLKIAFGRMVKKRAGWLAALFIGEMLTATAMAFFEQEIAKAVILALFVPLIISSGGNSGSQASTLVIRAMALGEVKLRDWWRVIRRELGAGLVLGTFLGIIGFLRITLWHAITGIYGQHALLVALTVFGSLIGVVTFGTMTGSLLPFILRRLGFDPASASAPFVATLVDVTGLVIYFTVASFILRGTLL